MICCCQIYKYMLSLRADLCCDDILGNSQCDFWCHVFIQRTLLPLCALPPALIRRTDILLHTAVAHQEEIEVSSMLMINPPSEHLHTISTSP